MNKEIMFAGFVELAAEDPDRIAAEYHTERGKELSLTYGELLAKAALGAEKLRGLMTRENESVAVMMPRGTDQLAAVLAVQMAGGAYIPIRTTQPAERVGKILRSADVRILLAGDDLPEKPEGDLTILGAQQLFSGAEISAKEAAEHITWPEPSDTAYIIFTSGSTGEPKGVAISHEACMNTIREINERFGICGGDAAINVSSYDFDLSVYDFFGMLSAGAKVVLLSDEVSREPAVWERAVKESGVTLWNSVPTIFDMFCRYSKKRLPESLRCVMLSGDWVSKKLYFGLESCSSSLRYAALGGATEASIWSNIYELTEKDRDSAWEFVPYGKALPGQAYMIVDGSGKECGKGVTGELYIGGKGVAKCYVGAPELTEKQFLTIDGQRWYKTGDAGYLDENDDIIFCGRLDSQVKINGFRIELGEIETALSKLPGVVRGACVKAENKGKAFIGALVISDSAEVTEESLKEQLKSKLPSYMVPEVIRFTDEIPLTSNGKVDRKQIALMVAPTEEREIVQPVTDTEKKLAAIWEEVLECGRVGRTDDLFELGGNSLTATSLLSAVEEQLGVELDLGDIFSYPCLDSMAAEIDQRAAAGSDDEVVEFEI